jgi:diguanylate cyclase (GGDEF)-like protein
MALKRSTIRLMEISGRFKCFLWRIIASGLTYDHDLEKLRKIVILNIIIILGCIFLSLLGALAFIQHHIMLGSMDALMLGFLILLFLRLKTSKNAVLVSKIGVTTIGVFYFVIFFNGGASQTAFVWHYTYPMIAIFLLGNLWGSMATFALLFPVIVVFALGKRVSWFPVYNLDLILRFIPSYISIYLFAFAMEKTRSIIQSRLAEANWKQRALIEKLETAKNDLQEMAIKDELTGLYNRRYFNEIFSLVFKRAYRCGEVFAALMIDIDYFKKYNDRNGHQAGDDTLKRFSGILSATIHRETDFVFRYGGEEFYIILTKTNRLTAEQVAGQIIQNLENAKIEHAESPTGFLTTSIGIALNDPENRTSENELVKQADLALYRAKQKGRNRYVIASD